MYHIFNLKCKGYRINQYKNYFELITPFYACSTKKFKPIPAFNGQKLKQQILLTTYTRM